MKQCSKCGVLKAYEEFALRNEGTNRRHHYCKACQREYCRKHYSVNKKKHNPRRRENTKRLCARNRAFIIDYLLEHPCVDCGISDAVVLEFDHVRPEKVCEVSFMVRRAFPLQRIQAEIEKCEVRCANCHRRKTAKEFGWWSAGM